MAAAVSLSKAFAEAVVAPLEKLGFKRRPGGNVFTRQTTADTLGWLGLNISSEHLAPLAIAVNPMVGVRFEPVEKLVAELRESKFHAFTPPTLRCSLGYLTPDSSYRSWSIEHSALESQIAEMVGEIRTYALPLYDSNTQLEDFDSLLALGMLADDSRTPYRRCAAAMLLGRTSEAVEMAEAAVRAFGELSNPAWDEFRRFAGNLQTLADSRDLE